MFGKGTTCYDKMKPSFVNGLIQKGIGNLLPEMGAHLLSKIMQLNTPINTLCTSGGLEHKTHSDHGIVFIGPLNPYFAFKMRKNLIR
jgi:hypothetical protein